MLNLGFIVRLFVNRAPALLGQLCRRVDLTRQETVTSAFHVRR